MNEKKMEAFTNFVYEVVDNALKNCDNAEQLRDYFVDEILDFVIKGTPNRVKQYLDSLK